MVNRAHVRKNDLLNFLTGQTQANKFIEKEREKRLSHLSEEESFREYITLCEFWEGISSKELPEGFEKQKISSLIKRRELLDKAGGIKR